MKPDIRAGLCLRPARPMPGQRLGGFGASRGKAALVFLLLLLGLSACQSLPTHHNCPQASDTRNPGRDDLLLGTWTVLLWGESRELLTLSPHPEHKGSWRGVLTQGPLRHAVVADGDDGEFTLEESHDGQRIAATWQGRLLEGGCGQQIMGHRHRPGHQAQEFLIMRTP